MRKILRSFTINEISAVRASAQEGAKAVIIKSHKPEDTQKMDNSLKAIAKQYGFPALAKHIADNGANISEAEFVAAGNEHYGKAEFTKMIANDATIYAACRKLNDAAIAKFEARWLPNTSGTAEKVGYGGGELASLEPISRITSTADGLTDDFKAMVEREQKSAPWLSPAEIYARCNAVLREVERANEKKRQRQQTV